MRKRQIEMKELPWPFVLFQRGSLPMPLLVPLLVQKVQFQLLQTTRLQGQAVLERLQEAQM
jgi:hypothetical protein